MSARLAMLLWLVVASTALAQPIDHPDPAAFDEHIRQTLVEAREHYEKDGGQRAGGPTHGALGLVYHAHGLLLPATQSYLIATRLSPGDARWPYYLGMIAAESGRLQEAHDWFTRSLELNSDYGPAKLRLARVLIALNRLQEAAALLNPALAEHPALAALHAEAGRLNLQLGHPRAAADQLERAIEMQPAANALYFALAMAYRDLGEADAAQQLLDRSGHQDVIVDDPLNQRLRAQSRSYSYFLKLGAQAAVNGDLPSAKSYLNAALQISPDNVYVLSTYARILAADGQMQQALEHNARALAQDPHFAPALEHRGTLMEFAGDDTAAVEAYRAALQSDPQLGDARRLLGNALMRAGQFTAAAAEYRILDGHMNDDGDIKLQLAAAEYEAGECVQAAETLAQAVRQTQNAGVVLAYVRVVATCPPAAAHTDQAVGAMRALYAVQPTLHAATTLAMIEAAQGDFAAAADYQAQAMFVATRDQRQELLASLKTDLDGYRQQRMPQRPWQSDHPLSRPPRLTPQTQR